MSCEDRERNERPMSCILGQSVCQVHLLKDSLGRVLPGQLPLRSGPVRQWDHDSMGSWRIRG